MAVKECIYCGESVELAEDGAWQGVEDGACGCMASLEQGGDGEHDGDGGGACAECGAPLVFHWTGSCPEREPAPDVVAGERGYLYCGGGSEEHGYD